MPFKVDLRAFVTRLLGRNQKDKAGFLLSALHTLSSSSLKQGKVVGQEIVPNVIFILYQNNEFLVGNLQHGLLSLGCQHPLQRITSSPRETTLKNAVEKLTTAAQLQRSCLKPFQYKMN